MDYSPQGWEKEKPTRWERKEKDLWITPEAGDYSPLREILEIMEIRTGSMDYSPQGWEKEKPVRGKRKEQDLWITARRAGRKKIPRQRRENPSHEEAIP